MIPAIFGCSGYTLTPEEQTLFSTCQPAGFILFARNVDTPQQVRQLVAQLKACVSHKPVAVLIDQEGGRVMRLKPPHWPQRKPAGDFAALWLSDPQAACDAAYAEYRAIAQDCRDLGITINCLPVADMPIAGSDPIISDRAYGTTPEAVIALGMTAARAHMDVGVLPVLKHIPGHGRATVDSHLALPVVDTEKAILEKTDFVPFHGLATLPWAMTAHIVYTAYDTKQPATLSSAVIRQVIRQAIGFEGVLISDDLNMKALNGTVADNAVAAIAAGCDLALHCSGDFAEMQAITAALAPIRATSLARLERSWHTLGNEGMMV